MKRFLAAMALASVLSISTFAGEIPTSGITAPPPAQPPPTALGEIPSTDLTQPLSDAALTFVQWVLGGGV